MTKRRKKITIIIVYLLVCLACSLQVKSQSSGCIDSVTLTQFFPSNFQASIANATNSFLYTPQRDSLDNVYLSGTTGTLSASYWSVLKFNAANQLQWCKNYKTNFFTAFRTAGALHAIEPNGNLIFSETIQNIANSLSFWQIISKADNGGNLLWSKILKHGTDPNFSGGVRTPVTGSNGELFCLGVFADEPDNPFIVALDNTGNMLWNKRYQHITVPKFHPLRSFLVSQNSSTLVMATQYYYDADVTTDPAAKFGLQLIKINKADGSIIQQQSFSYFNDAAGSTPNRANLEKINYDAVTKRFLLVFKEYNFNSRLIFTLLDENFNLLKSTHISTTSAAAGNPKITVDNDNTTLIIKKYDGMGPKTLSYTAVNNNLEIITQKFINLTSIGFPNRNFQADIAYKKDGILNFQLATYTGIIIPNYLFMMDHSPFYNNVSPCLGIDSVVYSPVPIYIYPANNPTIDEAGTVPLQITDQFPDSPPEDFTIPRIEICKEISICDTIKLFGTKYHCLSSPLDSFKIYRNPLCKRKTNWQVDTNYIKILSQTDSSLYVQYLQPYRGSIKVGFGGCSLTDSIAIEVYNAKTGVNLGNDTMHCPGKNITLKAGTGFKTYQWQDGSTKDSLLAAQPGLYQVTATDSCGTIFKDSLTINPFDVVLQTNFTGVLCTNLKDTAVFNLPNQLYNYSWLPATAASLNNYVWRVYPTATTTYSISGERLPGCIISDTVLINVKPNCLPDYIYFPTAFTPNNDGLNDTYKPGINGQLTVYEFIIFNRYGQPVFKSTTPGQGWDGYFKSSKKTLSGGYIWTCKYQFAGKLLQQEQGSFVLIR